MTAANGDRAHGGADGPTFSVVICTYNRAELLPRAIDSVLAQTLDDFELVVVDDGSTDATGAVVAAVADPRVRYVHQENQGLSAARNTGVAHAAGRYVTFLDDDDLALASWLEGLAGALPGAPAVVCCGELVADDDGTVLHTNLPGPLGPAYADYVGCFTPGTFAVRRDAYEAVGGFRVGLEHLHHNEFALRLLPECRARGWAVHTVAEPLVQRHTRGERRDGRENTRKIFSAMSYILDRHAEQLARAPHVHAQFAAVAGVAAARIDDYPAARRYLVEAVRASPGWAKNWARLGLATVPPAGRLVWNRHDTTGT